MALVKNTNSYATVVEADAYFADRLDVDAWVTAPDTQRAQALVTATALLDSLNWAGIAVSDSQPLAFPRSGTYFDPRVGSDVSLTSAAATQRLSTALFELAYHLLNNDGLLDDTGAVNSIDIGNISLKSVQTPNMMPSVVQRLIKPLQVNLGSRSWWRAN